ASQALMRAIDHSPDIPILALSLASGHFFPTANADVPMQQPLVRLDGVPFLQGAEYGLMAVGALMRYAAFLRTRGHESPESAQRDGAAAATARPVIQQATGSRLTAREGSAVLAAYGIP